MLFPALSRPGPVYDAAEPLVPGRKVSQVSSSGEVLCGLDAKDDRIVHLRAIRKAPAPISRVASTTHGRSRRCASRPRIDCDLRRDGEFTRVALGSGWVRCYLHRPNPLHMHWVLMTRSVKIKHN